MMAITYHDLASLIEEYSERNGMASLSMKQLSFYVVYVASGEIDNGGFVRFYERNIQHLDVEHAYRQLEMPLAADVIRRALELVPDEARTYVRMPTGLFQKSPAFVCLLDNVEEALIGLSREYFICSRNYNTDAMLESYAQREWEDLRIGLALDASVVLVLESAQ